MENSSTIQTWINAVTQPNAEFYNNLRQNSNATLGSAVIWVVVAYIISGIISVVSILAGLGNTGNIDAMLSDPNIPPFMKEVMGFMDDPTALAQLVVVFIFIFLLIWLFYIGLTYLVARLFGGKGRFGAFYYLNAAFHAPITIVSSLLGLVPILGQCIGFLLSIYMLVLHFFTLRSEHELSGGRAIGVIIVTFILAMILLTVVSVGFVAMLGPDTFA